MKITAITINHMTEPIGFQLNSLHINFKIESDASENIKNNSSSSTIITRTTKVNLLLMITILLNQVSR